jgi:integrase
MAEAVGDRLGKKAAVPLTAGLLYSVGRGLDAGYFNYLYITLHLGLRPSELDRTKTDSNSYRVVKEEGYTFLDVYQGKLRAIASDKRWKRIVIAGTSQKNSLELILAKDFKKPPIYELKKVFKDRIRLYSGRKGFAKNMLKAGWAFEDASRMLGHTSVTTTSKYYIDGESLRKDLAMSAIKRWEDKKKGQ